MNETFMITQRLRGMAQEASPADAKVLLDAVHMIYHGSDDLAHAGFLDKLRAVSSVRCDKWHEGMLPWTLADWSNAVAGEAGELANVIKKLRRLETNARVRPTEGEWNTMVVKAGEEIADTLIYLDLLAWKLGIRLEDVVIKKFNSTSEEFGFEERL